MVGRVGDWVSRLSFFVEPLRVPCVTYLWSLIVAL